ncbi:MAG: ABC transporter ATP-binding protein [Synergistaceae bacterium]|nr:ABC transporter ATP-binding protein [Synergistaceae bacterium]
MRTYFKSGRDKVYAVDGVNFTVEKGEVFGLIGESGCGKSATCRSIIGLIHPPAKIESGEVIYKGRDIAGLSGREWEEIRGKEIGMIFQEPMDTLNPVMKIKDQICDAISDAMTDEEKTRKAAEILRTVGIASPEKRMEAFPHEYSGGMRQRAMIAIALAAKPSLLLADEPTTALDVTIQTQIIKLLSDLKKAMGMSMILVTHDLGVAAQTCDRVAVMYAGNIMETADIYTIFDSPSHPYTCGLMMSLPKTGQKNKKLTPIKGNPPNLSDKPKGCPFSPRCDFSDSLCVKGLPEMAEISTGHFSRCLRPEVLSGKAGVTGCDSR